MSWWHGLGPAGGEAPAGTAEISISRSSREARGQLGLGRFKTDLEREWQVRWGPQEPTAAVPVSGGTWPGCLHIPTPAWEARTYVGGRDLTVPLLRAAGPGAPHCRPVLVSSPGSAAAFRQKGGKKKRREKKTSVLFSPNCFSQRLLVGVMLPLWAHSLLPQQLTHRCAHEAASCVGEWGAHAPRPDMHWSMPRGGQAEQWPLAGP